MEAPVEDTTLRQRSLDEIKKVSGSRPGRRAHQQHDRHPARLVHLSAARLGVPIAVFSAKAAANCWSQRNLTARWWIFSLAKARTPGTRKKAKDILLRDQCPACSTSAFRKETDIIDVWFEFRLQATPPCSAMSLISVPADLY